MCFLNKCVRKSSIQMSIRDIGEMKDREYTTVSNYIKDVKQELNESSVALGIQTLKDNPPFQIKEVGAAVEYRKYSKKIDKTRDLFGREVLKF